MSQQEFEPQQNERPYNSNVQENNQESEARPYYWSTKPNTGNTPKNEHPANFEDSLTDVPPIPPYSYQAQDRPAQGTQNTTNTPPQQSQQWQQRPRFSPDGDAFEQGYQPYGSYNRQAPPWARPQRNRGVGRIIFFIVLGFLFLKPLLLLVGGLFIIAGIFLGLLLLLLGIGLAAMFIIFTVLGRPFLFRRFRSRRPWGRWRGYI